MEIQKQKIKNKKERKNKRNKENVTIKRRMLFIKAIILLAIVSICRGKPPKFGDSVYKDTLSDSVGSLSTYFWDDKSDTFNISIAGGKKIAIFNYDINNNNFNDITSKCSDDGCDASYTYVSAGLNLGGYLIDESEPELYKFNGVGFDTYSLENGQLRFFIWKDRAYVLGSDTINVYDCVSSSGCKKNDGDTKTYDADTFNDFLTSKIIDNKYLAILHGVKTFSGTGYKYTIIDLDNWNLINTKPITKTDDQYSDISIYNDYIIISVDKTITLYTGSLDMIDSINEEENITACTFDKNTGLVYYATPNYTVCVDPDDFKLSSTSRHKLDMGGDSGASKYMTRRGELFVHRSGKLLFSYLYGSGSSYTAKLFSIEVDKLSEFEDMNITQCFENPIHRVWGLKSAKCMLGMSPAAEVECGETKCITKAPAVVESIEPSTGSTEGGTNVTIRMSGVNLTNISESVITIKLGDTSATNVSRYMDGDTAVINFITPEVSTTESLKVSVLVNGKLIHEPTKDAIEFTYYDCKSLTNCISCTSHSTKTEYPSECKWCALENICKSKTCSHGASGRELGNCPSFSLPVGQYSAPGTETKLRFSLKGEANVSGVKYYCHTNEADYKEGELKDDVMTCNLAAVSGNVSVKVSSSVDNNKKNFYAQSDNELIQAVCESFTSCTECLGYSHCRWYFNESYESFYCETKDASTPKYVYETCPAVSTLEPPYIKFKEHGSSAITLDVSINGDVPKEATYKCSFTKDGTTTTSEGIWQKSNQVQCTIPEGYITRGGQSVDVTIVIGKNGNETEPMPFYSLQCEDSLNSTACLDDTYGNFCGWCLSANENGTCTSSCDEKCWLNEKAPSVDSVYPEYFNVADGTNYTISGVGFVHESCGPVLQCVLSEESSGESTTVNATWISPHEISCFFDAITGDDVDDDDSDDDDEEKSGKTKRITRDTTGKSSYSLKVQDGSKNPIYKVNDKPSSLDVVDCSSKDNCHDCAFASEGSSPVCKWSVLRGVCTSVDRVGEYYIGDGKTSTCPSIKGFATTDVEAGNEVTISGEGFVNSTSLFVSIIDKNTGNEVARLSNDEYTYHNSTHISFTFPDLPAGSYSVALVSSEDNGGAIVADNDAAELVRRKKDKDNTLAIVLGTVAAVIVVAAIVCVVVGILVRRRTARGALSGFDFDIKNEPDYAKFKFAASLSNGPKLDRGLDALIPLLQNPAIACAICDATQSTEADKVTNSLIYVQASGGCAVPFITMLINEEVPRTPNEKQLFRGDGVISKAFRAYSKIVGLRYLWLTLGRVLNEIDYLARMQDKTAAAARERRQQDCELSEGVGGSDISDESAISILDTEVDPSKMAEGANLDAKVHLLYQRCSIVLDPILKSEGNMPPVLKWILHTIYQKVGEVFPGSEHIGIAGTFFLRFVCPSITIPQTYGLLKEAPIESLQRQLTLIAKVLQNTANNCNFGKKEPFMVALNGFVGTNCVKVAEFMERISVSSGAQEEKQEIPQDVINGSVRFMKGHLANNLKKLAGTMDKRGVGQYYQEIADIVSQ